MNLRSGYCAVTYVYNFQSLEIHINFNQKELNMLLTFHFHSVDRCQSDLNPTEHKPDNSSIFIQG